MEELKETAENEEQALESKIRAAEGEARLVQEQVEDLTNAKDEAARRADKKANDL